MYNNENLHSERISVLMNFYPTRLKLLAMALLIAVMFAGCGDSAPTPPENYVYGEENFPTIDGFFMEEQEMNYSQEVVEVEAEEGEEAPTEGEEQVEEGEETPEEEEPATDEEAEPIQEIIHVYSDVEGMPEVLAAYTEMLTTQSECAIVDEIGIVLDTPDFTAETGTMLVAREVEEPKSLVGLEVSWEGSVCRIKVINMPGSVFIVQSVKITVEEAADFLWTRTTEEVGLGEGSWADYSIYPADGIVRVDDQICYRLDVFTKADGNPAGVFFLSNTGDHLYSLDEAQGIVTQLIPAP